MEVDTNAPPGDEVCDEALADHIGRAKYVFGWPASSSDHQPVWVYHLLKEAGGILRIDGMEDYLGLDDLAGCETMDDYCEQLKFMGGTYYDDVRNSPEALHAGIVEIS